MNDDIVFAGQLFKQGMDALDRAQEELDKAKDILSKLGV